MKSPRIGYALLLIGGLAALPACAAGRYSYRSDRPYSGGSTVERIAHENGYDEGREAGEQDARRGRSFSLDRHGDWRDADEGYHREYGDKNFYRHEFREGFRAGYEDGYNASTRSRYWPR